MKPLLFFMSLLLLVSLVIAENDVNIYLFYGQDSEQSLEAIDFFETQLENKTTVYLIKKDVYTNPENSILLQEYASMIDKPISGIPTFFISNKIYSGFREDIANDIMNDVEHCLNYSCFDMNIMYEKIQYEIEQDKILSEQNISEKTTIPDTKSVEIVYDEIKFEDKEPNNTSAVIDKSDKDNILKKTNLDEDTFEVNVEQISLKNSTYAEEMLTYIFTQKPGKFDLLAWFIVITTTLTLIFFISRTLFRKRLRKN